jgi:hypothetical protein
MTLRATAAWAALGLLCGSGGAARAQDWSLEARAGGIGLLSHRSARFAGAVGTGSGTLMGVEVSLRHRYLGLAGHTFGGDFAPDSGLAAAGTIHSTSVRLQLGPRVAAAEIGYGNRAFSGSFATRHWGYLHLGARATLPIGATGLSAELGLALYAGLSGGADGGTSGRQADTRLVYAPARLPLYVAIGYRAERFTVRDPSDARPEAVNDFLFAVGARFGH